jgi:hypothetical protein
MKKTLSLFVVTSILVSCVSNQTQTTISEEKPVPITYDSVFQKGYSAQTSTIIDTIALGLYWGMTKAQVNNHLRLLTNTKKISRKYGKYWLEMPLTHYGSDHSIKNYDVKIEPEYYKDTLYCLNLSIPEYGNLTNNDLYINFNAAFSQKGYLKKILQPDDLKSENKAFCIPESDKIGGWYIIPIMSQSKRKDTEYRYVKNNTLFQIVKYDDLWYSDYNLAYYNLSLLYRKQLDYIDDYIKERTKEAEANSAREKQKEDLLNNF